MDELNSDKITHLLQQATDRNITVSFRQDELIVRFPKDQKPEPAFLEKLKKNKNRLGDYFREFGACGQTMLTIKRNIPPQRIYKGEEYYAINSTIKYWVDDLDKFFKKKLHILLKYKVTGNLNRGLFQNAVDYIVARHESLRTSFRLVNQVYYMTLRKPGDPVFTIEYKDAGKEQWKENTLTAFSDFTDKEFNVSDGPLLLSRLVKLNSDEYILSFWLHHAIFDGWSAEVFEKEIFHTYYTFLTGKQPVLAALPFQYKEYQQYLNRYTGKYLRRDQEHWQTVFPQLPPVIQVPCAKKIAQEDITDQSCGAFSVPMPERCMEPLNELAAKHSTSMYIVLQAFLNLYLCRLTGTHDILMASEVFGRDMVPGAEDQLGNYSKMRLIRTVLTGDEDIGEAIRKVRRSNIDMQNYVAFPLMDVLGKAIPGVSLLGTVCKISLNYIDTNGYYVKNKTGDEPVLADKKLTVQYIGSKGDNIPINWDFNIRFYNLQSKIVLRIIYRHALYEEHGIRQMINDYLAMIEKYTASFSVAG